MVDSRTRAQQNRAIRQEELRAKLSAGGHIQHAIDSIKEMSEAEDQLHLSKYKAIFDSHMKLVNKYLPELKATELTGQDGEKLFPDNPIDWGKKPEPKE
jgi:hypothetical protein